MSPRISEADVGQKLPTHLDLPYKDDKPVDNFKQPTQASLLTDSILPWLAILHPDGNFAIGQDSGIYFRITDPPLKGCRAPDWFLVEGVPRGRDQEYRRSYVMWQEKKIPSIILEFASGDGAEERDRTPESGKLWIYEQAVHAPFYGIFLMEDNSLEVFTLTSGRYVAAKPNALGRFAHPVLGIELGLWEGQYRAGEGTWLRWWDPQGRLLPTPEEVVEIERQRADQESQRAQREQQRAEQERQRADQLAEKLRALGIDPDAKPEAPPIGPPGASHS